MKASELKELIDQVIRTSGDLDVLVLNNETNKFAPTHNHGLALLIPWNGNSNVLPNTLWRRPLNDHDEPEATHVRHFVIY